MSQSIGIDFSLQLSSDNWNFSVFISYEFDVSYYPDVPDSKTFDVTLMMTLLRNLTPMTPPAGGYDILPPTIEVTPGADLARIKHYRNYLAHLDDRKIDIAFFTVAWTDITDVCKIIRFS